MKPVKNKVLGFSFLITILSQVACSNQSGQNERWYSAQQVTQGNSLFQANCAVCHGDKAQGLAADWKKPDANGNYPPPPLNGTAHAWHHPMIVLTTTIEQGGIPVGGVMPGFKGVFTEAEKESLVAYFQSFWSDEIYQKWQQVNNSE